LRRFQSNADVEALLQHAAATGEDSGGVRATLAALGGVFTALEHGEHPNFAQIDRTRLQAHPKAAAYVARMMAESDRADLKTAGLQVIGLLDDLQLMKVLSDALHSQASWLRTAAIDGLRRMSAVHARSALELMAQHEDPVTRQAAEEALAAMTD
jgi:hypothetical protein